MASKLSRNILVINCGSSSIKFQIVDPLTKIKALNGIAERIGTDKAVIKLDDPRIKMDISHADHAATFDSILGIIDKHDIKAIGHRVVHGGEFFKSSVIIDDQVKAKIKELFALAPIHNSKNLMGIELLESRKEKQVAVFDTSFHSSMPEKAYRYALPEDWYLNYKVRRYGFHGTSHKYVACEAAKHLQKPLNEVNLITAHLGNGCSIAAIKHGQSIDTSMGFSPLEGLIMGNRSGDIDANIIGYMAKNLHLPTDEITRILNHQSGFGAISGLTDSRDLEQSYFAGSDPKSKLAVDMFCYKIAKVIGSYFAVLESFPDAIVFTAGIGERSPLKRKLIINYLTKFGYELDDEKNDKNDIFINKDGKEMKPVMVIPTNEELVIAGETYELIK